MSEFLSIKSNFISMQLLSSILIHSLARSHSFMPCSLSSSSSSHDLAFKSCTTKFLKWKKYHLPKTGTQAVKSKLSKFSFSAQLIQLNKVC